MMIRHATSADLAEINDLYQTLFAEMAALQPGYFRPSRQDQTFLRRAIESPDSTVLLAQEERLLGLALVQERETPPYCCLVPHRYALVIDLVAAPQARSKGVGGALLGQAAQWARNRGLDYLELSVLAENSRALSFYEREGFSHAMHIMRKPL